MQQPNNLTIELTAIIARLFLRQAGASLKISELDSLFKVVLVRG
jgi:hypothetical protein